MDSEIRLQLDEYINQIFAQEDEALQSITAEALRNELPQISLRPFEGRFLQFLIQLSGAQKIVEIGTLAGYSGVWMARALPEGGQLYTIEKSSKHAAVARANFERADLMGRITLLEGDALTMLQKIAAQGPFDLVFIDADKGGYPHYLQWAVEHLRIGGIIAAHNALRQGRVLQPQSDDDRIIDAFNRALAENPRLESALIGVGDGFAVGIRKA